MIVEKCYVGHSKNYFMFIVLDKVLTLWVVFEYQELITQLINHNFQNLPLSPLPFFLSPTLPFPLLPLSLPIPSGSIRSYALHSPGAAHLLSSNWHSNAAPGPRYELTSLDYASTGISLEWWLVLGLILFSGTGERIMISPGLPTIPKPLLEKMWSWKYVYWHCWSTANSPQFSRSNYPGPPNTALYPFPGLQAHTT